MAGSQAEYHVAQQKDGKWRKSPKTGFYIRVWAAVDKEWGGRRVSPISNLSASHTPFVSPFPMIFFCCFISFLFFGSKHEMIHHRIIVEDGIDQVKQIAWLHIMCLSRFLLGKKRNVWIRPMNFDSEKFGWTFLSPSNFGTYFTGCTDDDLIIEKCNTPVIPWLLKSRFIVINILFSRDSTLWHRHSAVAGYFDP